MLKTNLLAIIGSGLVISFFGLCLYLFKSQVSPYFRYIMTIPPIGVASYVFVFNLLKKYNGRLPNGLTPIMSEIGIATLVASGIFFVFTILLLLFIGLFNHP